MFYTGRRSAGGRRIPGRLDEGVETERSTGKTEGRGTKPRQSNYTHIGWETPNIYTLAILSVV